MTARLRHAVTLLESATTFTLDAVVAADLEQTIVWANPAVEILLGWRPQELVGRSVTELVPQHSRTQFEHLWEGLVDGDPTVAVRTSRLRRDGAEAPVVMSANALFDTDGTVIGVSAVLRDLHESVEVRRSLQAAVNNARARFHQASTPQGLFDLAGVVTLANSALSELLRRPIDELMGRSCLDLLHPVDSGDGLRRFRGLARGGRTAGTFECTLARADGEPVHVIVDASLVRDPDGQPIEVAAALRDVTDLRRAVAAMERETALWRSMSHRSSDLSAVADADGRLLYVSSAARETFGYDPDSLATMVGYDFVHPEDLAEVRAAVEAAKSQPEGVARTRFRLLHADGSWRWVDETVANKLHDPLVRGLVLNLRDSTAEVEAERSLRESEARFRAIAEAAQEGILALDPDGRTLFANARTAEILGCRVDQIYDNDIAGFLHPVDATAIRRRLRDRRDVGAETYEVPYRRPGGATRTLRVSASPLVVDDEHLGSVGMISDVTEQNAAERNLRRLALHDPLTDLANRRLHLHRLEAALQAHGETAEPVTAIFLDIDQLKITNDTRGHHVGDLVLRAVADRLRAAVRPEDTVARIGGDEFGILCPGLDLDGARTMAERLATTLNQLVVAGMPYRVSVTIGIAAAPPYEAEELQRRADAAMYDAKQQGGGRIAVFDARLAAATRRRAQVAAIGRRPVDPTALELAFQPIVGLADRRLIGVETLLRWNDRQLGPVRPDEIVPVFAAAGRSAELDAAVLSAACRQSATLVDQGVLPPESYVAVNVSSRTLGDPDSFETSVLEPVRASGVSPARLVVEVTEDAVMRDVESATRALSRLAANGVRVAVDDFGTGYSSLARLHRLPLHMLKVDRSFVQAAPTDPGAREISRSILLLAKALGLGVVAEGVETEEQAALMQELGCDAAQGYLWSPAVPASRLKAAIKAMRMR